MAVNFSEINNLITHSLPDAQVNIEDLTGTGDHLAITISSNAFAGKLLIQQHRMIMDILKDRLKSDLHAVQLKTIVPSGATND